MGMRETYPLYLANRPLTPNQDLAVTDKYTGAVATRVSLATPEMVTQAIDAAVAAAESMRQLPPYVRRDILATAAGRLQERTEELARTVCVEVGKPIRDARSEVGRMVDTFLIAAEEAVRIPGEILNLEISPRCKGYRGMVRRVPIGPCGLISPFNFPLNLVAHKVAPAIAAGCPFVLKPASRTPVSALIVGEILADLPLPPGSFSILPASRAAADALTTDPRLKLLSFTGSPAVGWELKRRAGKKKVVLELGGNAACIVDADADLEEVVARLVFGAFYQSGQSCIGVQRILAHSAIYEPLRERLVAATSGLRMGNPQDESTFLGPLIDETEAIRLEDWIRQAIAAGGRLLCGGKRIGSFLEATLLEKVPADLPVCAQEAFGPVAVLSRFDDFAAALQETNRSTYGLQAGIFTRDLEKAFLAWDTLEVGGVVIGDVPSWRGDNMPYGGVKESGQGREGVRYAIEEMSELRTLVVRTRSSAAASSPPPNRGQLT